MSIAEQLATEDRIILAALAVALASLIAIYALSSYIRRCRDDAPLPPMCGVEPDYLRRLAEHQQCDAWPCPHYAPGVAHLAPEHCRCGAPWVCPLAGPLNTDLRIPRQYNRSDRDRGWA